MRRKEMRCWGGARKLFKKFFFYGFQCRPVETREILLIHGDSQSCTDLPFLLPPPLLSLSPFFISQLTLDAPAEVLVRLPFAI